MNYPAAPRLPAIPVYVIHATFMAERLKSIGGQLSALGIAFDLVSQNDPGAFDPAMVEKYLNPAITIGKGAQSCLLKHLAAFERIVERHEKEALILEDDVLLQPGFAARLDAIRLEARTLPPYRSIQIGAANNRYTPARQLRTGQLLYPATKVRATEAYIIGWQEAERYLAAIRGAPVRWPIDLLLNRLNRELKIAVYWAEPPLLFQGSMTGKFRSGIEHAPRRRNRLYNRIKFTAHRIGKYHLRRLWNRVLPSRSRQ